MFQNLPIISRSGAYDAEQYFPNIRRTPKRAVLVYELELFLEDGGTAFLGDVATPIRRGDILLARPGDTRCTRLPFRCFFLHFSFNDTRLAALLEGLPRIFTPQNPSGIEEEMRAINRLAYSERKEDALASSGRLLSLLAGFFEETPSFNRLESNTLSDACRFIEENYALPLTLAEIAEHCHLSRVYFHTLFTRQVGMTPHEYLMQTRLDAARAILRRSEIPLSEVSALVGFASHAYFSQVFRERTGMTPKEYRRRLLYPDAE